MIEFVLETRPGAERPVGLLRMTHAVQVPQRREHGQAGDTLKVGGGFNPPILDFRK